MELERYLTIDGCEIVNACRTTSLIEAGFAHEHWSAESCCCPGIPGGPYTSPTQAPWYNPNDPRSLQFLGFLPKRMNLSCAPFKRINATDKRLGKLDTTKRTLTITGDLVVNSCDGLAYGKEWLIRAAMGMQSCPLCGPAIECGHKADSRCDSRTAEVYTHCSCDGIDTKKTLKGIGFVEMLELTDPIEDQYPCCEGMEIALVFEVENPYLWGNDVIECMVDSPLSGDGSCVCNTCLPDCDIDALIERSRTALVPRKNCTVTLRHDGSICWPDNQEKPDEDCIVTIETEDYTGHPLYEREDDPDPCDNICFIELVYNPVTGVREWSRMGDWEGAIPNCDCEVKVGRIIYVNPDYDPDCDPDDPEPEKECPPEVFVPFLTEDYNGAKQCCVINLEEGGGASGGTWTSDYDPATMMWPPEDCEFVVEPRCPQEDIEPETVEPCRPPRDCAIEIDFDAEQWGFVDDDHDVNAPFPLTGCNYVLDQDTDPIPTEVKYYVKRADLERLQCMTPTACADDLLIPESLPPQFGSCYCAPHVSCLTCCTMTLTKESALVVEVCAGDQDLRNLRLTVYPALPGAPPTTDADAWAEFYNCVTPCVDMPIAEVKAANCLTADGCTGELNVTCGANTYPAGGLLGSRSFRLTDLVLPCGEYTVCWQSDQYNTSPSATVSVKAVDRYLA